MTSKSIKIIKPMENVCNKTMTKHTGKKSLFKKAAEISSIYTLDINIIIYDKSTNCFTQSFTNSNLKIEDELLKKF